MSETLDNLKQVKSFSDRGDYSSKHRLARQLIHEMPDQFSIVESPDNLVSVTHQPTGFRFHLPRIVAPTESPMPAVRKRAFKETTWQEVPLLSVKYAVAVAELAEFLSKEPYVGDMWASPETGEIKYATLGDIPNADEPWVLVKSALSVGDVMSPIGPIIGYKPFSFDSQNGPRPAASALAGGLIGGGLGYGGGSLLEWLMPGTFSRGSAKARGALIGSLLGAAPGAMGMALNVSNGGSAFGKAAAAVSETCKLILNDKPPELSKEAALIFKPINVDRFNSAIWNDPLTPPPVQAFTSGLVSGAGVIRNSEVVTPMDITRMAVGMGTGYASATLVGKTLGALAGLSSEAQKTIQQAGVWSGLLNNVMKPVVR